MLVRDADVVAGVGVGGGIGHACVLLCCPAVPGLHNGHSLQDDMSLVNPECLNIVVAYTRVCRDCRGRLRAEPRTRRCRKFVASSASASNDRSVTVF